MVYYIKIYNSNNCKVTCLMTCLLLYWPKIHRIFVNFSFFWHWVSLFLFSSINIINATYDKKQSYCLLSRPRLTSVRWRCLIVTSHDNPYSAAKVIGWFFLGVNPWKEPGKFEFWKIINNTDLKSNWCLICSLYNFKVR